MMDMLENKYFRYLAVIVLTLVAAGGFVTVEKARHGRTVISRLDLKNMDPANAGINIQVSQPWINPDSVLMFDVRKPLEDRDFDRFDVTRCLLQCARQLGDRGFSRIYLCNDGNRLYYINSDDFKRLGRDYKIGDNLNTLGLYVELPRVTHTLNDSLAFPPNTGLLGTIGDAQDWNTMMSNLMPHE